MQKELQKQREKKEQLWLSKDIDSLQPGFTVAMMTVGSKLIGPRNQVWNLYHSIIINGHRRTVNRATRACKAATEQDTKFDCG